MFHLSDQTQLDVSFHFEMFVYDKHYLTIYYLKAFELTISLFSS